MRQFFSTQFLVALLVIALLVLKITSCTDNPIDPKYRYLHDTTHEVETTVVVKPRFLPRTETLSVPVIAWRTIHDTERIAAPPFALMSDTTVFSDSARVATRFDYPAMEFTQYYRSGVRALVRDTIYKRVGGDYSVGLGGGYGYNPLGTPGEFHIWIGLVFSRNIIQW